MAIVVYSFQGAELVGNVASEAPHPEQALPKIIRTIGIRIILFYILAVSVLAILNPSGWVKAAIAVRLWKCSAKSDFQVQKTS